MAARKKSFKPPRPNRALPEGLRSFLDEQKSTFLPEVHLELLDDSQAVLEGCRGVLTYSAELVRLACGSRVVSFEGSGLELRCLSASAAVVTGHIAAIRLEG